MSKRAARLAVVIVCRRRVRPPLLPWCTKNFAYAPSPLEVHVGDAVVFNNSDLSAHTVSATDKSFDSGDMPQGATWKHVFTSSGTYTYTCAYHSCMKGAVVVKP